MEENNKPKLDITEEQLAEVNQTSKAPEETPVVKEEKQVKQEAVYENDRHQRVEESTNNRYYRDDFGGFNPIKKKDVPKERLSEYEEIQDAYPLPTAYNTTVNKFSADAMQAAGPVDNEQERIDITRDKIIGNNGATTIAIQNTGASVQYSYFEDDLKANKENMVNSIAYGENELNPRQLSIKSTGGNVDKDKAVAIFTSMLGMGQVVQIPLWNSGIWVSIKPPKQKDIVALEARVAVKEGELGRETSTLIYNNRSVILNNIVVDFVLDHVIDTSVVLKDEITLKDLILTADLNQLVLGVICGMFPEGFKDTKPCANSLVLDENHQIKCNYKLVGQLDPKKLLWLNKKALTKDMLEHMKNKRPNSVTVDAVKEYQLACSRLAPKEVELKKSDSITLKAEFKIPTLTQYLDAGNKWVDNIVTAAESMFTDEDNAESRTSYINQLASRLTLSSYNAWVNKLIIIRDGETSVTQDPDAINEILSEFYSDEVIFKEFMKQVKNFISTKYVSIVGTPSFICPECRKHNKAEGMTKEFEDIIPLDVIMHFFALGVMLRMRTPKDFIF